MSDSPAITHVLVTGATGFVGRAVVHELLRRGVTPVCLVRSADRLRRQHREVDPERLHPIVGSLGDRKALQHAADVSQAAIHLVGIIIERHLRGQSFHRIHVRGTQRVVEAVRGAGIRRYVHMSAMGTRPDAVAMYHKTKWQAEQCVRGSGLDWTIFRPSLIHGANGEFMQLMKRFMTAMVPPAIPYFGSGHAKLQPVSVNDVAFCMTEALFRPETIGVTVPLGGPKAYTWIELYETCRCLIPGAKAWKPLVSQPVPVAKTIATLSAPLMAIAEIPFSSLRLLRFDRGQVTMSQEDSTCDHTIAEKMFHIQMRSFEKELAIYASEIR